MSDAPKILPPRPIEVTKKVSTATEKALKAKAEMESLFQAAIDEQLAIIKEAEQRLGELGYSGHTKSSKTGITRKRDPNAVCSICNFATTPKNHDGRMHRNQGKNKKPFTAKELEELGLKKA
jgi:hypothetical protein